MTRTILISATLAAVVAAGPAFAMNCDDMFTKAQSYAMKTAGGKRVAMSRLAVTAYDSCMAGDTLSAEKYFKMLQEQGG